ncbi:MAG: 16S rRNA (guanine(966)-N(2))-methyltransferase RsmD [Elusimicrobia bacterium CG1_02_37_114]|nr:MAG: 16S rRNA (guanine(966)-N(2))-methyltransferase RsmD [Elusimicrobia bacterium CG1_02_37_114]
MIIISGKFRGRKIKTVPDDRIIRPILSRIKKSLFDIINPRIKGANFLDLYAGSGAVGIEALSRGVKNVVFVELNKIYVDLITKNIEILGGEDNAKVCHANIHDGLAWLKVEGRIKHFSLIFLGPPYKDFIVTKTLELISKANLLSPNGMVIAQHHKKENVNQEYFKLVRQENYGDSKLSFFTQ